MNALYEKLLERRIVIENCWLFDCAPNLYGYGRIKVSGKTLATHRIAYEATKGPIPEGLQIDHLCRNRLCFKPDHLEAVTPRENVLRGASTAAQRAKVTHCPVGHPYSAENTRFYGRKRHCRACHRALMRARREHHV